MHASHVWTTHVEGNAGAWQWWRWRWWNYGLYASTLLLLPVGGGLGFGDASQPNSLWVTPDALRDHQNCCLVSSLCHGEMR